ncbi:MAG: hypothetical protein ACYDCK_14265 [Thermoplasmatota archaeon]
MRGEVVYMYLYDLGAEVDLERVGELLHEQPQFEPVEIRKSAPHYVSLPRPLSVQFRPLDVETSRGPARVEMKARIFGIGAVSISLRVPFDVGGLADLIGWGALKVRVDGALVAPETLTRTYFTQIRNGLAGALVEPYPVSTEPEAFTVFAIDDLGARSGTESSERRTPTTIETLLLKDRRTLAGLVAGEPAPDRLSAEEVEDNLRYVYRYYNDDLVVVDWDYALVVEPSGHSGDILYVMELANLQLLELRAYDGYLDGVLDKAYDDLNKFYGRRGVFRSARDIQRDLSEARIDLTRVTDEIENIGKIYGDWSLAKLHVGLTERFHTREWQRVVESKMQTLNELYELASHEVEGRRALLLEGMVIGLFIVDVLLVYLSIR